jgi:hypothetical protein
MKMSELFNLVWSEPVTKTALRFGMSDRGLAKLCARHHIPLPERGYWAKIKAGQYPARMPLPCPGEDYDIALKESTASGDFDDAPAVRLQNTMGKLFHSTPKVAAEAEPEAKGHLELDPHRDSDLEDAQTSAVQKSHSRVGRPRKQVSAPADKDKDTGSNSAPKPLHDQRLSQERLTRGNPPSQLTVVAVQTMDGIALEAECQRVMAAGLEYQRRQAAQALLSAVVTSAYSLDEKTSAAVLHWARAVHKRLALVDPVVAVISEIRAFAGGNTRK